MSEQRRVWLIAWVVLMGAVFHGSVAVAATNLPALYFELLNSGIVRVERRVASEPAADLQTLESTAGWKHFPSAMLVAAVLHTQPHPANPRHGDAKLLSLAQRIGDLLANEHTLGHYTTRLDHHRDTYMWLDS